MNESSNRRMVIVGVFVLLGLLFLIAGVLIVGDLHRTFEKKFEVVALFDDVSGLQRGNNVWLSGVKVGLVSEMAFYGNSQVEVHVQIDINTRKFIPKDSKVKISSDGFIGNRILVIYGGTPNTTEVKDGDTLTVERTFSSEDVLNTLQKNNENVMAITNDIRALTLRLMNGEGTLGKLLADDALYSNISGATASLKQASEKVQKVSEALATYSSNLNSKGTLANQLATDTVVFASLKTSVVQLQQIADTASVFISSLKKEASNPNSSIGVLMTDKESGASLKETIKNMESSSVKLNEDLEALQHNVLLKRYFKKKAKTEPSSGK
jgi:phospholipid/cholesterol/gamma-HCH transport system substrate-binding protein